ncbi:hypothetical protein NPIL_64271 [Nephila pilipes]|uniref:Uncharacterized protein n=1 Tax=Nephila pilipes TaxID=299642 RepID=A0A8X6PSK6_NEPPI|nr:hypothetical protein NPIL_64271 [Nephila pilipes]
MLIWNFNYVLFGIRIQANVRPPRGNLESALVRKSESFYGSTKVTCSHRPQSEVHSLQLTPKFAVLSVRVSGFHFEVFPGRRGLTNDIVCPLEQ